MTLQILIEHYADAAGFAGCQREGASVVVILHLRSRRHAPPAA